MGTPKPLNTTTLMCIKHILRRNILCFNILQKLSLTFILLFNYISSSFLHLSSMMPRNVVADHSSKELLLHLLTPSLHPTRWSTSSIHSSGSQTLPTFYLSSSLVFFSLCLFTGLSVRHPSFSFSTCLFTGLSLWLSLLRRLLDWSSHFNGLHSSPNFKQCDSN